jgi:flavin reductase (DIM6/NTAB) family NADH-FMN oxidoreductase RutF
VKWSSESFVACLFAGDRGRAATLISDCIGSTLAPDKFAQSESEFEEGLGGCPRLRHSAATFECATYSRHTEGDWGYPKCRNDLCSGGKPSFASEW